MLAASRRALTSLPTTAAKASYATAAATQGVQISTAKNGIKVASIEEPGQTAGLAVVVNGGSRLENDKHPGVAHYLKNYGFKNNANRTAFRIAREAELAGAILSSNLSHESIVYASEFLSGDAEQFAEIVGDVVSKQKFQDHEFVDVRKQTLAESANAFATCEIATIEAAHKAAFRKGLGNSIFAKPSAHIDNAAVKAYANELFLQNNVALVGSGIEHGELERLAETYFNLPAGEAPLQASKYHGGETRIESVTDKGSYVIAFEGAPLNSAEYAAAQVLRYALGGEQTIKFHPSSGLLAQAASKFSDATQLKAFNFGYSDAGLFGVYVSAPAADASAATAAAAEQLSAVAKGLSQEELARAIAQAKFAAVANVETRLDRLESVGVQALQSGKYTTASELAAVYGKLSAADVAKVKNWKL
ncbi:Metalloenzyme, LuxS/M16 peptidase-like protein [Radiomyces spectabilis]|uniref:Metalloenzyme, LuxS/M16 peptidase-like protein n=1 Tax=Radiomyces spectabilis TaxID=64574 RepID=UPI00221EE5F9|nr:Metalloenzyme, LuxS/M16 peptidase-like protein [Radiomyces spectabilis]KAI8377768.1 Metalloenzyme, LuxS/M16 peptidase-like protein [Radiomyces spectabilis]